MYCRYLSTGVNYVDYELETSILQRDKDSFLSVNYHEFSDDADQLISINRHSPLVMHCKNRNSLKRR